MISRLYIRQINFMKTYCTFGNGTIFNWMFQVVKNMPSSAGIAFDVGSSPGLKRSTWIGKISWSRKYKPTPVFLPGELHGERSLVGYNPWHHKELDTTERLNNKVSHVSGIIRYLSFCAWFLSLNIMFSRFIHVIDNVRSSSFYD